MVAACPARVLRLVTLACLSRFADGGYVPPTKYLIVSNARSGTIGYAQISRSGNCSAVKPLVVKDLKHPQGIAVDQKRQLLVVADSDLRKVVSYGLTVHEDGSLSVDEQTPLAEDIESRWVAVDGPGNVYMTDEQTGKILKITAQQVLDGDTTPKLLFADRGMAVSAPGGVATDNFHVYWTNKIQGDTIGTVARGLDLTGVDPTLRERAGGSRPTALVKGLAKAYGVCLVQDTLYFTDSERNVFAVKTTGGQAVKITGGLSNPRGCAWDGDGSVYIADRTADAVFALPAPMFMLAEQTAEKKLSFEGAFGVAVYSRARRADALHVVWSILVSMLVACRMAL